MDDLKEIIEGEASLQENLQAHLTRWGSRRNFSQRLAVRGGKDRLEKG